MRFGPSRAGRRASVILALTLAALSGRAQGVAEAAVEPAPGAELVPDAPASRGAAVAEAARGFLGKTRLVVNGRRYRGDCSGLVLAVYDTAGMSLDPVMRRGTGGGVQRLWDALVAADLAREGGTPWSQRTASGGTGPRPGDLVFWDNTYDRNGDGLWNDPLTHVGIVSSAGPDGSLEVIHYHYSRGVVSVRLSLRVPDDPQRNDPMRMRGTAGPDSPTLAGQLYRGSGSAWSLPGQAHARAGR